MVILGFLFKNTPSMRTKKAVLVLRGTQKIHSLAKSFLGPLLDKALNSNHTSLSYHADKFLSY